MRGAIPMIAWLVVGCAGPEAPRDAGMDAADALDGYTPSLLDRCIAVCDAGPRCSLAFLTNCDCPMLCADVVPTCGPQLDVALTCYEREADAGCDAADRCRAMTQPVIDCVSAIDAASYPDTGPPPDTNCP